MGILKYDQNGQSYICLKDDDENIVESKNVGQNKAYEDKTSMGPNELPNQPIVHYRAHFTLSGNIMTIILHDTKTEEGKNTRTTRLGCTHATILRLPVSQISVYQCGQVEYDIKKGTTWPTWTS